MEDIGSFWIFQESVDDLKQKLQYTTYELEMTRKETNEEIKKNNDHIKRLLQLLQTACKERDEAKSQLKKLQQIMGVNNNNYKPINNHNNNNVIIDQFIPTTTAFPATPFSPDSPLLTTQFPTKANSSITESSSFSLETQKLLTTQFPTKANSSITESSSFSLETQNNNNNFQNRNRLHVSSPAASSPDSCNIVFSSSAPTTNTTTTATPPAVTQIGVNQTDMKPIAKVVDQESLIIANLAKGRPLPQKGKLLQAVLDAGPLLSTLMVAGSLPQWRNPPGVLTHQIPPVNLKGCGGMVNQSPGCNKFYYTSQLSQPSNILLQSSYDGTLNGVMGHSNKQVVGHDVSTSGNSGMYNNGYNSYNGPFGPSPSPLLDFGGGSSGSCYMGGRMMMNSGVSFDCLPKRQRIV